MKKELIKKKVVAKAKPSTKIKAKTNKQEIIAKELRAIKKLNKIFEKSTPAAKRIIIVKDVIAQIEAGKFIPTRGEYFEAKKVVSGNLQECIITPDFSCNVCNLGGLFTSLIKIDNKFKVDGKTKYVDYSLMDDRLKEYFSEEQLCLIETAFEECRINWKPDVDSLKVSKAENFRSRKNIGRVYLSSFSSEIKAKENKEANKENDRKAMLAICRNIISNKGSFRPER